MGLTPPSPPPPYTPPTPLAIHKSDNEGHRYHSSPTQRMALANFVEILCIWTALSISLPTGVWLSRRGAFAAIAPAVHGAVHGSATTTRKKTYIGSDTPISSFILSLSLALAPHAAIYLIGRDLYVVKTPPPLSSAYVNLGPSLGFF